MGQKKLIRFEEIRHFSNVLEYPSQMKGKWHEFFGNNHPITLELACGKGEYAVGLGRTRNRISLASISKETASGEVQRQLWKKS
jgi:tRNA G46 methylase TrmB